MHLFCYVHVHVNSGSAMKWCLYLTFKKPKLIWGNYMQRVKELHKADPKTR